MNKKKKEKNNHFSIKEENIALPENASFIIKEIYNLTDIEHHQKLDSFFGIYFGLITTSYNEYKSLFEILTKSNCFKTDFGFLNVEILTRLTCLVAEDHRAISVLINAGLFDINIEELVFNAILNPHTSILKELVKLGVDTQSNLIDTFPDGRVLVTTPIDMAKNINKPEVVKILEHNKLKK